MQVCKTCAVPLDDTTITDSVGKQERINRAYNSANNLRLLAGSMWVAFFFSFIPFIGIIGRVGFYLAFLAVPIFLIVWLVRYGNIDRSEPDMIGVSKKLLTAFGLWVLYPILFVALMVLVFVGAVAYEISK